MNSINAARLVGNAYTDAGLLVGPTITQAITLIVLDHPSRTEALDAALRQLPDLDRPTATKLVDLAIEALEQRGPRHD